MTPDDSQLGRLAGRIRDLEPGSRALLDLSVRRRLDDGEIASLLGTDADYVKEARAHVMKSVAADLRLPPAELERLEGLLGELPPDAWLPVEIEQPGVNGGPAGPVNGVREEAGARAEEPKTTGPAESAPEAREHASEEPSGPEPEGSERRRVPLGLILTIALLLLLGAGGVAMMVTRDDDDDGPAPIQPAGQAPGGAPPGGQDGQGSDGLPRALGRRLEALGAEAGVSARARMRRGRVLLVVAGLRERRNAAYQSWAYDSVIDAKPLERLRPTESGRLRASFDADRARGHRFIDVSLERFDGNNSHSGRSLLRIRTRSLGIRGRGASRGRR